ncbi:ABC transporter permease [Dyadobacter psychrophilus]|uniref:Duplicated orphan permease n=1 Tax=Dyadobacter psychrophilus TaxID=651661 RepID=A0A1T5EEI6_9BACT|nr:ABC transporter permease [Dyadobacter psychrophilus]SKB82249.1 duplicated orphan permease [Dyadobacter psychrophilus]
MSQNPPKFAKPPRWASTLLRWWADPNTAEEVEGDLLEMFAYWQQTAGSKRAKWRYALSVLKLLRPFTRKKKSYDYPKTYLFSHIMIQNYFKIALRNILKHKGYAAINIGGLSVGMAVAMLIGLWVYDEVSFDKYHKNHDRIVQLFQFVTFEVEKSTYDVMPIPLAGELRTKYPDFKSVVMSKRLSQVLAAGDNKFAKTGSSVEPDFLEMMSVNMLAGTRNGLDDANAILLSESLAKALFGDADPLNQLVKIDNKVNVKVTGVYEDFPNNSTFKETLYITPWELLLNNDPYAKSIENDWDSNSYQIYAQLKDGADPEQVSAKIREIRTKMDDPPRYKPEFFLHPMNKWHLYGDFKNGVNTGGLIQFVWLFGIIGVFVLLLACINFMNLSTARSEKRAKEVGIRKAIGSLRGQLISQFFSESLLVVLFAFVLSVFLAAAALPFFNEVAQKQMSILWLNPYFWLLGLGFSLVTGIIAGSYPAIYLSSFQPLKVLKGRFSAGRFAAIPRKVLVVMQFTVSVTLIIGTIIIFRQIQFAKNRPVGYSKNGLIEVKMNTPELLQHYEALRLDLLNTGAVKEMAQSSGVITTQDGGTTDISWEGKSPDTQPLVMHNSVTHDYGKTIGWQILQGRDFSRTFSTDSSAMILNESAAKLMNLKKPLDSFVRASGRQYKIIGVVKDMIKENPFSPVSPSFFVVNYRNISVINIRLTPDISASEAIGKVESVFKKYNPGSPFTYSFADEEYSKKFGTEERIGKLASFFAILAIFISCLGLFGLASFVAEQRTKEIGIRKVLGASVANLWGMLSKDFVLLVIISCLVSIPISWYVMSDWLKNYKYHTEISWWIFALTGLGALGITLLTVSYQAIKAALLDPVKSLRSE